MAQKILRFDKSNQRYIKLATERVEKEDLQGALCLLFDAEKFSPDCEVYARIADVYADMGLLELSNRYWFKYLHTAPKDKASIAYEELAINYFYIDNVWAAGYYFQKKLSVDGFISKENIDKEVLDFFSGEEFKKHAYRIVYPHEKADYSLEVKSAKRAIALGAFEEAVKILEKIPKKCLTEETSGDYAIAAFMSDDLDKAETICRDSIKEFGENLTAYCNLSTVYGMRNDSDKSKYYYQKALSVAKGEQSEAYKLATCAIEQKDDEKVKSCLEKILKERPYEISMRYFYGICALNLGDYESAVNAFKFAFMLDPTDLVIEYFYDYATSLLNGNDDKEKLLPLKYEKEIPKKVAQKWSKKINDAMKSNEKAATFASKKANQKLLSWGVLYGDDALMRASIYIMSFYSAKNFSRFALNVLMDAEVGAEVKRLLIYVLVLNGHKGKVGVVAGSYYCNFSLKKLSCEKDATGALYYSAYALCLSKMVFFDIDDFDRIAKCADKVYLKLKGQITPSDVTNEELAALILSQCSFEKYSKDGEVSKIFDLSDKKLKKLKQLLNGEF